MFYFWVVIIMSYSCSPKNQTFNTHVSGLQYLFHESNPDNALPNLTDILTLNVRITNANDSVIFDGFFNVMLSEPSHEGGCIEDALSMMHQDDSASFLIDTENFYTRTRNTTVPFEYKQGDKLRFDIRLKKITTWDEEQELLKHREQVKQHEESLYIDKYIQELDIQIEPTLSGLYIITLTEGLGKPAVSGSKVTVKYEGSFLDGRIFQTTFNTNKQLRFELGKGSVIQAWEEAISTMREGGKIRIITPSYLAYGNEGMSPIIPPYTPLMFVIQLIDVE